MSTLEQRRASHAWEKAGEGIQKFGKNYVTAAKGLPALIMNSGLMQVMAFMNGKGGHHELLAQHLLDWLHTQIETANTFPEFMEEMMHAQSQTYQHTTTEAMAWLRWLRQLADARFKGE